ncbi:hypothetical protein BC833DRAFT_525222 [Globomyces pollinis-pini]|nr:hypothetical protein BC833DRAFT_525222 [Globomyces pollinis-pini]
MITTVRPKNVCEELKSFLQANPNDWFTNEDLADRLNYTPSGIRNAVTKLKHTHLIKTKMTGPLAYRGWHTACDDQMTPLLEKKHSQRCCNHCQTQNSRYWRSDLDKKNGWLCNNCGMNQRRSRNANRTQ